MLQVSLVSHRKRWHLFPPEDTAHLYPTRIPYEESSVFSQVHVVRPDLSRFPLFRGSRAHEVTLEPGQVRMSQYEDLETVCVCNKYINMYIYTLLA